MFIVVVYCCCLLLLFKIAQLNRSIKSLKTELEEKEKENTRVNNQLTTAIQKNDYLFRANCTYKAQLEVKTHDIDTQVTRSANMEVKESSNIHISFKIKRIFYFYKFFNAYIHVHTVLVLRRKFKLIPIKIGFFTNFLSCSKIKAKVPILHVHVVQGICIKGLGNLYNFSVAHTCTCMYICLISFSL